jgi:hypothetical protein
MNTERIIEELEAERGRLERPSLHCRTVPQEPERKTQEASAVRSQEVTPEEAVGESKQRRLSVS